jgi:hypothetical protein
MYAIKTRSGGVYLRMKSMGGAGAGWLARVAAPPEKSGALCVCCGAQLLTWLRTWRRRPVGL